MAQIGVEPAYKDRLGRIYSDRSAMVRCANKMTCPTCGAKGSDCPGKLSFDIDCDKQVTCGVCGMVYEVILSG